MHDDHPGLELHEATVRMRACRSSYFVLGAVPAAFLAIGVAIHFAKPGGGILKLTAIAAAVLALIIAWLRGFEVTIQNDVISIKKFLRSNVVFPASQITYFDFEVGDDEESSKRDEPMIRLVFKTKDERGVHRYMINAKVFSMDDLNRFGEAVERARKRGQSAQ